MTDALDFIAGVLVLLVFMAAATPLDTLWRLVVGTTPRRYTQLAVVLVIDTALTVFVVWRVIA